MIYVGLAILGLYMVLNICIGVAYSMRKWWNVFYIDQTLFGKICAVIFYFPSWVVMILKYGIVFAFYWVMYAVRYIVLLVFKLAKWLYAKFKTTNL